MTLVTPERRARMSAIGRLGGLTTAAKIDTQARARVGQSKFRDGFADGHSCRVCPGVTIPADLPDDERKRRANQLYRLHFTRLGQRSRR